MSPVTKSILPLGSLGSVVKPDIGFNAVGVGFSPHALRPWLAATSWPFAENTSSNTVTVGNLSPKQTNLSRCFVNRKRLCRCQRRYLRRMSQRQLRWSACPADLTKRPSKLNPRSMTRIRDPLRIQRKRRTLSVGSTGLQQSSL